MFSNLASYLGYQLAPAELEPDVAEAVNLSAVEDDEWLLVERHDQLLQEPTVSEAVGTSPCALPGARTSMQESWYITPPPSFTRESVHMETSPLENLLIEHPSMSVYQKSGRRKTSKSSRSASEDDSHFRAPSEEDQPESFKKLPRSKYSKRATVKRPPVSSSDDGHSLPSEDEEKKEIKMKNFVKSPRRSVNSVRGHHKFVYRRAEHSSSDEMISIPSNNEEDAPTIGALAIEPPAPPRKLYSEVLRTKPKVEDAPVKVVEAEPAPEAPTVETAEESSAADMVVEEAAADKDRRAAVAPDHQRQTFLNRSAQKMEQRKTCEMAKRNSMGRTNKAREMNSRNKRQRRSDMMQRHSGVNNNRKCY